jgi:hypothetical protein
MRKEIYENNKIKFIKFLPNSLNRENKNKIWEEIKKK